MNPMLCATPTKGQETANLPFSGNCSSLQLTQCTTVVFRSPCKAPHAFLTTCEKGVVVNGATISHCGILEHLGSGGTGVVDRVEDSRPKCAHTFK